MTTPGDEREPNPSDGSTTGDSEKPATGNPTESATGNPEELTTDNPEESSTGNATQSAPENRQTDRPTATEPPHNPAVSRRRETRQNRPPHYGEGNGEDDSGDSWAVVARDVGASLGAVALIGFYLFAISGVWPPMVAIESGSMEPNMDVNDLVFVMDADRFQPEDAQGDTGVVTAQKGDETTYTKFGETGDVVVFAPNGNTEETPIIHRAMFWVEEGENWCESANPDYLGSLDPGSEQCESPHDGFITKGDRNQIYDQVQRNEPVKPEWVIGTAEVQVPGLGWFRLQFQ